MSRQLPALCGHGWCAMEIPHPAMLQQAVEACLQHVRLVTGFLSQTRDMCDPLYLYLQGKGAAVKLDGADIATHQGVTFLNWAACHKQLQWFKVYVLFAYHRCPCLTLSMLYFALSSSMIMAAKVLQSQKCLKPRQPAL